MTKKPKELLELERKWLEAKRVLMDAYKATDFATRKYVDVEGHVAKAAAWNELNEVRKKEHAATFAFLKLEHALTDLTFRLEHKNPCGGEFTPRSSRVHWSNDPEKRERQRKHIAESIAAKNPAHAVHNLVTLLGAALELVVKPPRGRQFSIDWHDESPKRHVLCCPGDLKAVLVLEAAKPKAVQVPAGAAAERAAWRMWSSFTVDGAIRFSVPSGVAGVHLGAAKVIRYRSDKWTGQDLNYEHRFGAGVQVFADRKQHPRVIFITADPPKRLVTARGIVG